jgi:hypothetical protein
MTQFRHDEFAKAYLTELLNTIGKAVPNKLIRSESREADLPLSQDTRPSKNSSNNLSPMNSVLALKNF